ncbi:type II secretion system F family protein [Lentisphaerota bacterium WC36G]|nr:type II secretion system F family protein [Lentisphaerae bacterium WC36]
MNLDEYIVEIVAAICAGISIGFAAYLIIDFTIVASKRYRERYINERANDFDDLFIQLPTEKVFEISLLFSSMLALISSALLYFKIQEFSIIGTCLVSFLTGGVGFLIPKFILKKLRIRRLIKFNLQLEDALSSMSSSLKAGFSINQALEEIAKTNINPISVEFRLLMQEIRLGVSLDEALHKMCNRTKNNDFELVATAIITARQTGGELTAIFDRLADMIRERNRIGNKLRAMTAMGKMQANIIGLMPFVLLAIIGQIAPGMVTFFFQTLIGIMLLIVCVILVITGFFFIKKILTIDI